MSIEKDFEKASKDVRQLSKASNEDLLSLYSLYKQATVGDVSGPKPGTFDLKGKAKYKAWSELKGTSKNQAMTRYVGLVKQLLASK